MKKNIGYVNLDSSMARWLKENLPASDLKKEIDKLLTHQYNSLVLENDNETVIEDEYNVIQYGSLIINSRMHKVQREGIEISLTPKEFDILWFLASNRGEVFTKEQIYQAVWDNKYMMDDSNIMAFIRKLRKKIEVNPDEPEYIITIWGIGYKFNDKL